MLNRRMYLLPALCLAFGFLQSAPVFADLLKCPECTNMVSDKAAACPKCGATIEFIKQNLAASPRTNAVAKEYRNCAVKIQSDTAQGFGVAVEQDGMKFIICDLHLLEGAESLELLPTTTNVSVRYERFELAVDRPLARFTTDSTNIVYLRISSGSGVDDKRVLALSLVQTNGQILTNAVEVIEHNSMSISVPAATYSLLCVCDLRTNLAAIVQSGRLGSIAWKIAPQTQWISVGPLDFRQQTRLLHRAEQMATDENADRTQVQEVKKALESTQWLTKYLHDRAAAALQTKPTQ